jgi:hypothetical protein
VGERAGPGLASRRRWFHFHAPLTAPLFVLYEESREGSMRGGVQMTLPPVARSDGARRAAEPGAGPAHRPGRVAALKPFPTRPVHSVWRTQGGAGAIPLTFKRPRRQRSRPGSRRSRERRARRRCGSRRRTAGAPAPLSSPRQR